jgi:hypothetical protein
MVLCSLNKLVTGKVKNVIGNVERHFIVKTYLLTDCIIHSHNFKSC